MSEEFQEKSCGEEGNSVFTKIFRYKYYTIKYMKIQDGINNKKIRGVTDKRQYEQINGVMKNRMKKYRNRLLKKY